MKRILALLLAAVVGDVDAPTLPGTPTARMCILRDFGAPDPANKYRTLDPLWQVDIGALTEGTDGEFYSTAPNGGFYGKGLAFKVSRKGVITVLHPFRDGLDGGGPRSGLIKSKPDEYWGTTYGGGKFKTGTIFRIGANPGEPDVRLNLRNSDMRGLKYPCDPPNHCPFTPKQRADAAPGYPIAPPVPVGREVYFGVTPTSSNMPTGTLWKLSPPHDSTAFETVCIFDQRLRADTAMARYLCSPKGRMPSSLILSNDGKKLYGTLSGDSGYLFEVDVDGPVPRPVTIIHQFTLDGGVRPWNLMQASDNNLYGTTYKGGDLGQGVIYRFDPDTRDYRVMTSFRVNTFIAGINPVAGLVEGLKADGSSDGWLYGATRYGGRNGGGALFRIPLDGDSTELEVLHDFGSSATGNAQLATPIALKDGSFYGITSDGGTYSAGLLWRLTDVDLPPRTNSPTQVKGGVVPKQKDGILPARDDLVEVRINARASQTWKPEATLYDAIAITVGCRNPHFVQFVHRERLDKNGNHIAGQFHPTSGPYDFTMEDGAPNWHADAPGKPDAYYDHGPLAGWWTYVHGQTTWLTMVDQPGWGDTDYPVARQGQPHDETWRITAKTFAFCNCEVKREIRWKLEMRDKKQTYKDIEIKEVDNAVALRFINDHLGAEYRRIPQDPRLP